MTLKRKFGSLLVIALLGSTLSLLTAGTSAATAVVPPAPTSGGGGGTRLRVTGSCGDILDMREKTLGTLTITITIPSADPTEVWSLTAQQQLLSATTGGAVGDPVSITPNPMPPLAFSTVEGGFSTTADFPNTAGVTHAFSYTATRTVPTPVTCTNQGFWTNPGSGTEPVVPPNPIGFPDSAPALTGATEADTGTNDVLLQFDQQLLDTAAGIPAPSRFAITVDGAARTPTAVQVVNDSPPGDALVDVTFDGAALTTGQTVGVTYRRALTAGQPFLQDLEGNAASNFGPISVPVF